MGFVSVFGPTWGMRARFFRLISGGFTLAGVESQGGDGS